MEETEQERLDRLARDACCNLEVELTEAQALAFATMMPYYQHRIWDYFERKGIDPTPEQIKEKYKILKDIETIKGNVNNALVVTARIFDDQDD